MNHLNPNNRSRNQRALLTYLPLICLIFAVSVVACDGSDPITGPGISLDFDCARLTASQFQCSANVYFADGDVLYDWAASFLEPQSGIGVSTVVFDWQQVCEARTGREGSVTVKVGLAIESGKERLGPISKGYEVCIPKSVMDDLAAGRVSEFEILTDP